MTGEISITVIATGFPIGSTGNPEEPIVQTVRGAGGGGVGGNTGGGSRGGGNISNRPNTSTTSSTPSSRSQSQSNPSPREPEVITKLPTD